MRVVLDTNVLLSAFLFGGRLQFIVELIAAGKITQCFSSTTWAELCRVLEYPKLSFPLEKRGINLQDFLSRLSINSLFFFPSPSSIKIPKDKSDEAFIACALAASAKAIITGDKHLLALQKSFSISILTPQEFKKTFKNL